MTFLEHLSNSTKKRNPIYIVSNTRDHWDITQLSLIDTVQMLRVHSRAIVPLLNNNAFNFADEWDTWPLNAFIRQLCVAHKLITHYSNEPTFEPEVEESPRRSFGNVSGSENRTKSNTRLHVTETAWASEREKNQWAPEQFDLETGSTF